VIRLALEKNIEYILRRVEKAAIASNRNPKDVQLIAVTKTVDIDIIKDVVQHGITHVGENKVQELTRKYEEIGSTVKWHLIGHLQRNKVKYIIDKVDLIHSLDSYKLADEIHKRAREIDRVVECLVQVNVSGEETKYGVDTETAKKLVEEISKLHNTPLIAIYNSNNRRTRFNLL